jgi:uncharacterized protein with PQ loop repeat
MLKRIIASVDNYSNIYSNKRSKTQSTTKLSLITIVIIIIPLILVASAAILVSTLQMHLSYAQNNTPTTFGDETIVFVNGKSYPLKYSITTGKLLGVVEDKDKTTLIAIISAPSDKGTLTIEIPRNILDDKGQSNADAKYTVHVDGKDATFREISNTKTARTLAVDFNKNAKMIEIIGTQVPSSSQT